ncbi:MAG: calcium/sodium antiporter [Neisseriaceae bacterium]|nr:calcium/sodium antiporter [Neisseriaceae bacterium]
MILSILAIIVGLIVLVFSADKFIDGSASVAKIIGIPSLIIGMLIVGFGTSAPEITVSIIAALNNSSGIALGNAYGSNITNIALILGITAIIYPITAHQKIIRRDLPILTALTLLSAYMVYDLTVSRLESWVLLGLFVLIMSFIVISDIKQHKKSNEFYQEEPPQKSLPIAIFWVIAGFILLVASSKLLVWGSVEIAHKLGVSDLIIGLTIVAVGTSLPELAASVIAAKKGEDDIAIGNVIGSNMFNLMCVVGFAGVIRPIAAPAEVLYRDVAMMLFLNALLFAFFLTRRPTINRPQGVLLLMCYIAYTAFLGYMALDGK